MAALRSEQLPVRVELEAVNAAGVTALVAVITTMVAQTTVLEEQVRLGFGQHPDAEIYLSQPGLGTILSARVLAEMGDDPERYADARARKNYAGMAPITRASGTKRVVLARYMRNRRLADALYQQAFSALSSSPGGVCSYLRTVTSNGRIFLGRKVIMGKYRKFTSEYRDEAVKMTAPSLSSLTHFLLVELSIGHRNVTADRRSRPGSRDQRGHPRQLGHQVS